MKSLKIACTERTRNYFFTDRETIEVGTTDYTDVAVAVVSESDIESINDNAEKLA
jgi:ornithine decarboxylase